MNSNDELYISQPDNGERVGNRTRVKVVKNKIAPPFKEAEFDIIYGTGISREGDILDLAVNVDIIRKSGSWYSYEGMKLAQGRESTQDYLKEHSDFMAQIEQKVRGHFHLQFDGNATVEILVSDEYYEDMPESLLKELEKDDVEWVKVIKSAYLRVQENRYEEYKLEYAKKRKFYCTCLWI